jgi:hypothetical protein
MFLNMAPGQVARIQVDQQEVSISCRKGSTNAQIDLTSKDISTSLTVGIGQSIEIGSILRDLKSQDQSGGIHEQEIGAEKTTNQGNERSTYRLTIN